jgi:hypothetical protein
LDELCNFLDEVDTGVGRGASPPHTKAGELVATGRRKAPLSFIRVSRPVHSRAVSVFPQTLDVPAGNLDHPSTPFRRDPTKRFELLSKK